MSVKLFRNSFSFKHVNSVVHLCIFTKFGTKIPLYSFSSPVRGAHTLLRTREFTSDFTGEFVDHSNFYCNINSAKKCRFHTTTYACKDAEPIPNILQTGSSKVPDKSNTISKAMKAYLQRAKQHDEFMKKESEEFEIGRRHLANMMGVDADSMTQDDIDSAIQYLFPSALFEKKARPMMKPPQEIHLKKKAAEFDYTGRPFHYMYYTKTPNFYQLLHEAVEKMSELNTFEDKMLRRGIRDIPSDSALNLSGTEWFNKEMLEAEVLEKLKDEDYEYFIQTLTRLVEHKYSFKEKNFILQYRKRLVEVAKSMEIPPLKKSEQGMYSEARGLRKTAVATVVVWGNGSGKVKINGSDLTYFSSMQDREQVLFPLQFTDLLGKVDIDATVSNSGHSSQAGAIRYAISLAIKSFLEPETIEKMRIAGLLTRDRRKRERKKPGQKGARAKYTWKKR